MKSTVALFLGICFVAVVFLTIVQIVFVSDFRKVKIKNFSPSCFSIVSQSIEYLFPEATSKPFGICGNYFQDDHLKVPKSIRCAFPLSFLDNSSRGCDVTVQKLTHLNKFAQVRQAEVEYLLLKPNKLLLLELNSSTAAFQKISSKTWSRTLKNDLSTFSFKGQKAALVLKQSQCPLQFRLDARVRRDQGGVWVVMWQVKNDSPFLAAAIEYCKRHGYGLVGLDESQASSCFSLSGLSELPKAWKKIALVKLATKHLMGKKGWMLWLDETALITNSGKSVEEIIQGPNVAGKETILLVGQDTQPPFLINSNVFISKISSETLFLFETLWTVAGLKSWRNQAYWDQNAIQYLMDQGRREGEYNYWHERIRPLPQRVLFSFMRQAADDSFVGNDFVGGHWKPGDFIALLNGLESNRAEAQAKLLLENGESRTPKWINSKGAEVDYMYPKFIPFTPPIYAVRLDTFFKTSEPTFLEFYGRKHNETWEINPSCVWRDDFKKLECVVRSIPYDLDLESGEYNWPCGGTCGNSIVVFFTISEEEHHNSPAKTLVIKDWHEMSVPKKVTERLTAWVPIPSRPGWFRYVQGGWEDMKLLMFKDELYGFCTNHQLTKFASCEMVMVPIKQQDMVDALPMRGYKPACHKNWMPFVFRNEIHLIEKPDPLVVLKPSMATGQITVVLEESQSRFKGLDLRGTSNGVEFENGYLFLVHETLKRGKDYVHRFLYIEGDGSWQKRKLSRPFYFVRYCVEFGIGITMVKDKSVLVIGFGLEDKRSAFLNLYIESPKKFLTHENFWKITLEK